MASSTADIPDASLEAQPLDLASLASVREAATKILGAHPRIDVPENNAGLMRIPERRTEDGFEMQLGVNHLGHFAFTALLVPALLRSPDARVVSVTSWGREAGRPIDPEKPHMAGGTTRGARTGGRSAIRAGARSEVPLGRRAGQEHRRPGFVHTAAPSTRRGS